MNASKAISSSRKAPPAGAGNGESSSSTAERFTLAGPSLKLDPRIHAYRSDIADIALAGQLFAPHYARPLMRLCTTPSQVRSAPSEDAEAVTELAAGEEFAVIDVSAGWAWGYRRSNHHVGYVPEAVLDPAE